MSFPKLPRYRFFIEQMSLMANEESLHRRAARLGEAGDGEAKGGDDAGLSGVWLVATKDGKRQLTDVGPSLDRYLKAPVRVKPKVSGPPRAGERSDDAFPRRASIDVHSSTSVEGQPVVSLQYAQPRRHKPGQRRRDLVRERAPADGLAHAAAQHVQQNRKHSAQQPT